MCAFECLHVYVCVQVLHARCLNQQCFPSLIEAGSLTEYGGHPASPASQSAPRTPCLCLPRTETTGSHCSARLLCGFWGSELQPSCLHLPSALKKKKMLKLTRRNFFFLSISNRAHCIELSGLEQTLQIYVPLSQTGWIPLFVLDVRTNILKAQPKKDKVN